ncbi:MAG: extracellular solute-binding protein [Clostridiales bacterium]|nr:extracellular solute-binding protein [Clostridiales bacterium]
MKKFLKAMMAIGLSSMLMFGVGCGGDGTTDEATGEVDASGNTVIKIMFHVDAQSAEGKAYKQRIDAFNAAYKDQKIKASASYIARTAGAADYEQKLVGMQNEGSLPDIITFDAPNCASYANSGLIYDISDLVPQDVQDDFLSLNKYDGKLYGLPIQESSAGFFYNKNLFAQAGINVSGYTVENPWTFAQFKDVCAKLKAINVTPVDMRLDATKDETATYLLYPFIYAAGGEFLSEDGYTAKGYFDSAATQNGFQFLKDLVSSGYTSYAIGATDFFDGKVGMYLSSGWTIPDLDNKYPQKFPNRDSWGLLPYPKGAAAASATGSWSFAITDNHHEDKTAIKELLLWMTTVESSQTITNATGMIPARKSVENNYAAGSPESVLLTQLALTGRERPVTVGYPQFSTTFRNVIYEMKDKSVATVLSGKATNLQSELDKLKRN